MCIFCVNFHMVWMLALENRRAYLRFIETVMSSGKNACCYMLVPQEGRCTYIGATVDLKRRLRQHNGELKGGARATQKRRPWRIYCSVEGFLQWQEALSFEYHWKKKARGVSGRILRLKALLASNPHLRTVECTLEVPS